MLDSLHRRPRGRALAPVLSRLSGGKVAPSGGDALRAYEPPEYADVLGGPSRALLDRVDDADVAEVRRRVEPELAEVWRTAAPATQEHLKLILGVHYGVEPILAKTGLRPDTPPEDVHAMGRGPFAAGGDFWLADLVAGAAERAGASFESGVSVLDFGSSSGRHLRVLQAWRPEVRWMGCDPNAGAIAWASQHLPGIEFFVSPQDPPLALAGGSLDVVFAVSVWSHFGAGAALAWLEEMHRLIRPGGVLVFTTQGFGSLAHYLRQDAITEAYAVRAVRGLVARGHHYVEAFGESGDWGVRHAQWGMAYMTLDWLAQRTADRWDVALYEGARVDTNQDLVVLRRR
jgi:SAM-dependent methyltransferase